MPVIKVGQRGQMTIPRKVRDWMDISDGDRIVLVQSGSHVEMIPVKRTLLDLRGVIPVSGPQDFTELRREAIVERAKKRGKGE